MDNSVSSIIAPMLGGILLLIIVLVKIFSDHKGEGIFKTIFTIRITEADKYQLWGRRFGANPPEPTWSELSESEKTDIIGHKDEVIEEMRELYNSDRESYLESFKLLSPEIQKELTDCINSSSGTN